MSPPRWTPVNIRIYFIFLETRNILLLIRWIYLRSNFSGGLCEFFLFLQEWRFGHLKSSKVIDFDTNWMPVCDFLLVRHSNLGPILHRFGDIAGLLCSWPHPYSTIFLGCSRWTRSLKGSIWSGIVSYSAVKLFLCEKYTWTSRTDGGQTDRWLTVA